MDTLQNIVVENMLIAKTFATVTKIAYLYRIKDTCPPSFFTSFTLITLLIYFLALEKMFINHHHYDKCCLYLKVQYNLKRSNNKCICIANHAEYKQ